MFAYVIAAHAAAMGTAIAAYHFFVVDGIARETPSRSEIVLLQSDMWANRAEMRATAASFEMVRLQQMILRRRLFNEQFLREKTNQDIAEVRVELARLKNGASSTRQP